VACAAALGARLGRHFYSLLTVPPVAAGTATDHRRATGQAKERPGQPVRGVESRLRLAALRRGFLTHAAAWAGTQAANFSRASCALARPWASLARMTRSA
jgi:hypothetical protein